MCGFQVYGTEVDDRGVDFVARYDKNDFIEIQVKSLRKPGYVFMQKEKFHLRNELYLALVLLFKEQEPILYLIPSLAWAGRDPMFVSRDYEGLKSKPEWGLQISETSLASLEPFSFWPTIERMKSATQGIK